VELDWGDEGLTMLYINIFLIFFIVGLWVYWTKKQKVLTKKLKDEEAKIIQMEKMASLGTLAAGVAHEINNPLTFLDANLGLLLESRKKNHELEDEEELVSECLDGVVRIKRIVKDLLTFSHKGCGERVKININEIIDTTLRIVWNEIKYKVDLVKDYKIESTVWIDPNQISQVFINLIINAYHAIQEKGVITIATYEDEDQIFIKISDNGAGMPKEVVDKIFEPFFTTKGGTGLGLSVTNEIVEQYGAKIEVTSKVKQGTVFLISLPKK